MRRFDASYRWFLFRANPVRDESGKIVKWYGTNIDIEDRKRVEDGLRASELSWRQIVDSIPGFVATTSAMGEIEFLNRQLLEYFGKTTEELKNWALIDAVHPDDLPRVIETRKKSIEAGHTYEIEHRCRRADGVYRWFQVRGLPVRDEEGLITAWYLLLTDIEDLKKAEEALQANDRNLSLTINTIPTLIAVSRPDGTILSANQAALDYHGVTLQDVQKEDFRTRFYHPDDVERVGEVCKEALKHPRPFEYELRALGKDGEYRWFLVRHNPLLDEQGRIDRWYVTAFDIEDRKKAEEALQSSERNLRQITNAIPSNIHVLRPDGSVLYVNQAVLDYHGTTLEDVQKQDYRARFFHPDDIERLRKERSDALLRPVPFENEQRAVGKDGKYHWFLIRYNPLLDEQGKVDRWYVAAFDIEDRKQAEDALIRQAGVRADVSAAFSKPTHLGEILHGCTEAIVRQLDAAFARIWTLSKDESMLELQASAGMYTRLDGSYSRIPVGDLKVGSIAREKKPHLTNNVMNDPRVNDKAWAEENGMVAFAGYPMLVEDRLIGVVALFARRTLSESILDTLASIADTIAQGIERKRAEGALRNALDEIQKSESKLRQVIDTIPALAWCNLPDGPNEFLNKGWHEYTGVPAEQSHGWSWQNAFHPDDLPPLMEKWMKMLTSGEPDEIEARLRRHDGVYRWFLIRAQPFRDESGKIVRWYGTSTDIDDRKRAEEALQSSERNLRQVIDTIPTLIHVLGPDGSVLYVNPRVLDYTGLTLEDVQRGDYRARVGHPEDAEESLRERRAHALSSAVPFESEYRVLGKDGQYRWFLARYNPLLDDQGKIDRWYVTATDIDDRKRAEAEIEQAYLRLAEAQRVSKTGSFVTDLLLDEHNWSEELCRIFEIEPGTRITAELIRTLFHPEDLPVYEDAFKRAVAGLDRDIDLSYRIITPAGNVKHLHAVTHILEKIAGRPIYIGAIQDVTESKVAEEALTRARAELAHMSRVTTLSALTASIAHEINQPIFAVITSAGACLRWLNRDQPEVQRAREAATRIEEDGKRAAEIITHLKSFYKKDVSPQRDMVSVNDVAGEMLVLLRSEADRHSVVMRTELAPDLPSASADRVQLQQVLMNLMLNGIEAMSERGGELKTSTRRDGGEVMVSVSDTGEGVPTDKLEEIFNPFVTTKAEGTGMGLAISQTIIESHGGRLWATMNPGGGATFHFTLPTGFEAHE
jgi:PAS domain S-box-containing protein